MVTQLLSRPIEIPVPRPGRMQTDAINGRPVRSHLAWSVVSALLCFAPTGVVAVVFAARVQPLLAAGDAVGARRASRLARRFCCVSLAATASFVLMIAVGLDGYANGPTAP